MYIVLPLSRVDPAEPRNQPSRTQAAKLQPNFSHNLIVISDIKRTTLGGGHVILYCPSPELILLNPGINQFQDSIAFN